MIRASPASPAPRPRARSSSSSDRPSRLDACILAERLRRGLDRSPLLLGHVLCARATLCDRLHRVQALLGLVGPLVCLTARRHHLLDRSWRRARPRLVRHDRRCDVVCDLPAVEHARRARGLRIWCCLAATATGGNGDEEESSHRQHSISGRSARVGARRATAPLRHRSRGQIRLALVLVLVPALGLALA